MVYPTPRVASSARDFLKRSVVFIERAYKLGYIYESEYAFLMQTKLKHKLSAK
jgi:hypothetical protein